MTPTPVHTIADNGVGIPTKLMNKVFDTFKEVGKRTGLGLAICLASPLAEAGKIVVEKHGGTIAVNSEVGKGTE